MEKIKLTKREYLGEGYLHYYKNSEGEDKIIPCTKEEYENINNVPAPQIEGLKFTGVSIGGAVKVNTPDYIIKENEYCDFEDGYYAVFRDSNGMIFGGKLNKDKIVDDFVDNKLE